VAKLGVKWDITVVKAELNPSTLWDNYPADPAPDVYVELTVGSQTKSTSTIDNTYSPAWGEYLLTDTTQNITSPIEVTVADADPLWTDNVIASCTVTVSAVDLVMGSKSITGCGNSPDLLLLELSFSPSIYF
jgi:hypothetical protein